MLLIERQSKLIDWATSEFQRQPIAVPGDGSCFLRGIISSLGISLNFSAGPPNALRNVQSLHDLDLRSWSVLLRNEFSELARDCFLQDVSDNFVGADEITGQRASHSRYLERLDQSFISTVLDITTNVHVLGFPLENHYRPNANIDMLNPQNGGLDSTLTALAWLVLCWLTLFKKIFWLQDDSWTTEVLMQEEFTLQ